MQVQNWMTAEVVTIEPDTPIVRVLRILQENGIQHLPVMSGGALVGMITESDVKEAFPTRNTTLTSRELYYLLAEIKARDIMHPDPITIQPDQTMEVAAVKMLERNVSGIPVVTPGGKLVGIISRGDVFRVLISITGIYQGGVQFAFNLEDRAGTIKDVANVLREEGGHIISILSTRDTADEGYRHVFIRITGIPADRLEGLIAKLKRRFMLLYLIRDPLQEI